jgi:hypothetical protein
VNPRHRPATVRFYFDADVLGLAKVMVKLRSDVTYPGDPGGVVHRRERLPCSITSPATPDEIWIPETARQGWLIITRDSRIQHHQAELDAVRNSGARMITLASDEARALGRSSRSSCRSGGPSSGAWRIRGPSSIRPAGRCSGRLISPDSVPLRSSRSPLGNVPPPSASDEDSRSASRLAQRPAPRQGITSA